jgi:hypothetical protein
MLGTWNWWAPRPLRALWRWVGLGEGQSTEPVSVEEQTEPEDRIPLGV